MLDKNGSIRQHGIAAIQRAIQLKNTYNIRVINLSWAAVATGYAMILVPGGRIRMGAGIVVVVAAATTL